MRDWQDIATAPRDGTRLRAIREWFQRHQHDRGGRIPDVWSTYFQFLLDELETPAPPRDADTRQETEEKDEVKS